MTDNTQRIKEGSTLKLPPYPKGLGWSIVLAVVCFNLLVYDMRPGIGWSIFYTAVLSVTLLSFEKRSLLTILIGPVGILCSIGLSYRSSGLVFGINSAAILTCFALLIILRSTKQCDHRFFWWFQSIFMGIALFFENTFVVLGTLGKLLDRFKFFRKFSGTDLLSTFVITFVLLIVFGGILASADPVFADILFEWDFDVSEVILRVIFSLLIAIFMAASLSIVLMHRLTSAPLKGLSHLNTIVPGIALALLFGLFLFVQARYLFGSHANIQAFDITYSDYVRKGFAELLFAATLAGFVIYLSTIKVDETSDTKQKRNLQIINAILTVEVLGMLFSALQRDLIYIEAYGITRIRIVGLVFLSWLAASFLILLLKNIVKTMSEKHVLGSIGIATILCIGFCNLWNIDLAIAKQEPPEGRSMDIVYISLLSADAAESWHDVLKENYRIYQEVKGAYPRTDEDMQALANAKLSSHFIWDSARRTHHELGNALNPWQEWNYGRSRIMGGNATQEREAASCIFETIRAYQVKADIDLYRKESRRLYSFEYPLTAKHRWGYYPENINTIRQSGDVERDCSRYL